MTIRFARNRLISPSIGVWRVRQVESQYEEQNRMTNRLHPSISALHRRWAKLENEHQELAMAIAEVETGTADAAAMRERQARVLLEIEALMAEIRGGSLTTLEDIVGVSEISCVVGHDESKGARPCRAANRLVFLTLFSISC